MQTLERAIREKRPIKLEPMPKLVVDLVPKMADYQYAVVSRQVIIVVQIGAQINGLLVDAVSDILSVSVDTIQPTPEVAKGAVESFIRGVMAIDGRMIGLIELDSLMPAPTENAA